MSAKCLTLLIGYVITGSIAGVAPFIKPCTPLDSECIINSANIALPHFARGIEELGISAVEPLHINDVKADTGDLKLGLRKITIHQLSKCVFDSIIRDPVQSTASMKVHCPIIINGDYTLNGQLFFLNIEGEGGFEIKGGVMSLSVDLKLKSFNDEQGKKHYKVGSLDYSYNPIKKFDIKFENLFNGDKAKAAPVEQVLNDSWRELILDIGKPVMKEGILTLANVIDKFLKAVPADELEIA